MGAESEGTGQELGAEGEGEQTQTRSLDDLLAGLPEADRSVVLGEVGKARNEAKSLRTRLKDAEPKAKQFDTLSAASQSETERLQQQNSASEARAAEFAARAVKSEVKALAATTFADPEDAHAFLTLSDYVDENGDVNADQIQQDLKELLTKKPHLARGDGKHAPRPDLSQGSGTGGTAATPEEEFASFIRGQLNG